MFVGLRDLWFARGRFLLMTSVVALVALLVVMLSGLTVGLAAENISAVESLDADHIVFQDTGTKPSFEQSTLSTDEADQWANRPGVTEAALVGVSRATVAMEGSTVPLVVFAADPNAFVAPTQLRTPGTVLLSQAFGDAHNLVPGDQVDIGGTRYAVSLRADESSFAHSPVGWMVLHDWQRLTGNENQATVLSLQTTREFEPQDAVIGTVAEPLSKAMNAIGSFTEENGSLQMIRGFLLAISALVIGAFFTVWTIQRGQDIAVLKAIGASTTYLLGDALGQAAIVLVFASLTGGGIGFVVGRMVSGAVPFVSDMATTVYPLLAMVALGLVGAALAIRSITKVDPLTALGGSK